MPIQNNDKTPPVENTDYTRLRDWQTLSPQDKKSLTALAKEYLIAKQANDMEGFVDSRTPADHLYRKVMEIVGFQIKPDSDNSIYQAESDFDALQRLASLSRAPTGDVKDIEPAFPNVTVMAGKVENITEATKQAAHKILGSELIP